MAPNPSSSTTRLMSHKYLSRMTSSGSTSSGLSSGTTSLPKETWLNQDEGVLLCRRLRHRRSCCCCCCCRYHRRYRPRRRCYHRRCPCRDKLPVKRLLRGRSSVHLHFLVVFLFVGAVLLFLRLFLSLFRLFLLLSSVFLLFLLFLGRRRFLRPLCGWSRRRLRDRLFFRLFDLFLLRRRRGFLRFSPLLLRLWRDRLRRLVPRLALMRREERMRRSLALIEAKKG